MKMITILGLVALLGLLRNSKSAKKVDFQSEGKIDQNQQKGIHLQLQMVSSPAESLEYSPEKPGELRKSHKMVTRKI